MSFVSALHRVTSKAARQISEQPVGRLCPGVLSWSVAGRLPVLWRVTSRGVLRGKPPLSLRALGASSQLVFVQGRGAGRVKLHKC